LAADCNSKRGWKTGDFVIWDNQATWHFAVNDYEGPRAYRKVIGG
jgi:alpha-ketoglutarate-dependent taurine dioxygenase